jgi:hypothetical protein
MSQWTAYPTTYREKEVQSIHSAVQSGECVSVIGLSGAGKSNLMGFLANRQDAFPHPNLLVDCNRLLQYTPQAFFDLLGQALIDEDSVSGISVQSLQNAISQKLAKTAGSLTILLDRFDVFPHDIVPAIASSLRSLRDAHKYQLTYVVATRRPLNPLSELAELFFAHTIWLGPLSESDARWNVQRYAQRRGLQWGDEIADRMIELSGGYPALLKAVGDAYAMGAELSLDVLGNHPAVIRRVAEFWADAPADAPADEALQESGLRGLPLLMVGRAPQDFDTSQLTAKEHLLLEYLRAHPGEICDKDALIQAVWPEDEIFDRGVRDDSLAQLVRRLRVKIEPDPSAPRYIQTVTGRGYRFKVSN